MCKNNLLKLISINKIEHFHEEKKWINCARFFCHDLRDVSKNARFRIKDCELKLYSYQIFEIYVMLKMKIFQNERYNVDDMRLRKIYNISSLKTIVNLITDNGTAGFNRDKLCSFACICKSIERA